MTRPSPPFASRKWSSPSVVALAGSADPVKVITDRARSVILGATEQGLKGPPFDIFDLAAHLKVPVIPREDIRDARTIPGVGGKVTIEFNPNRPRGRARFSVAHELAHTLFPDCIERIRNRSLRTETEHHDAELETLCNVAAAELLMPIGSFSELQGESLSIDHLMELRRKYDVSTEALLLRVVRLTREPCLSFTASRLEEGRPLGRYRVDYAIPSRAWQPRISTGSLFNHGSVVEQCTAIGFTAKGREEGPSNLGMVQIECVGIPPYPSQRYPRVVGIITPPRSERTNIVTISYLKGDATDPRGTGSRLIAHIVNDKGLSWGAGFGLVIGKKWPAVRTSFREWALEQRSEFTLGAVRFTAVSDSISLCHMVAQHGYGPSPKPRIRYASLWTCLGRLADESIQSGSSVHMPRIGSGQAGGSWWIVRELIEEALCKRGVSVTVYDPPERRVGTSA